MTAIAEIAPLIAAWPPPSLLRLSRAAAESRADAKESMRKIEETIERDFAVIEQDRQTMLRQIEELRSLARDRAPSNLDLEDSILMLEESERRVQRDTRIKKHIRAVRHSVVPHGL